MKTPESEGGFKNLRKWNKTKNALGLQANWRIGLFFYLKPKKDALEKLLKDLGLRVTSFDAPEDLFKRISDKNDIVLIFCDWEPQKESSSKIGLNFLSDYKKFAKANPVLRDIPVILVTYHFTANDLSPAIRLGASDILIMPTTIDIVGEKVLENISKSEEKLKILMETSELMDRAEEFVRTGNYRAAIKIYEDVIHEHGEAVEVLEKQAEACVRAGQIEDAISCYKKCVAIEKSNARACQGLGNCYCQLGMLRNAREYYLKVLELEPENAFVDHKIGRTYLMENNLKAAERHLETALGRNPHFYEIYEDLARIKCDQQRADDAADILSQFIKRYPEDMRGHIEFAETLIKAERYQEAEEAVRQGILEANKEKYAPPVALYNRWGIALRKQDKYLAAIQKYELALKIEPNNPEIHFNIAKAYFESGEKTEIVVKKLAACFEIDPSLKDEFWEDKLLTPLHKYFPKPVQKN